MCGRAPLLERVESVGDWKGATVPGAPTHFWDRSISKFLLNPVAKRPPTVPHAPAAERQRNRAGAVCYEAT